MHELRDLAQAQKKAPRAYVLICIGIIYAVGLWLGASRVGGMQIFSSTRTRDRNDFQAMVTEMSNTIRKKCSGPVLFDDEDIATPYLSIADEKIGDCQVIRETVVTPFTAAQLRSRSMLIDDRMHLKAGSSNGTLQFGLFGFKLIPKVEQVRQ